MLSALYILSALAVPALCERLSLNRSPEPWSTSWENNLSTTTAAPVSITSAQVTYTGQALLTGACATPIFSALHFSSPQSIILEVPLVGCSDERPECCPQPDRIYATTPTSTSTSNPTDRAGRIKIDDGAWTSRTQTAQAATTTGVVALLNASPLAVCPQDFVDLDGVCCPSGFSLYPTALYSKVIPCYRALATAVAIPQSLLTSMSPSPYVPSTTSLAEQTSFAILKPTPVTLPGDGPRRGPRMLPGRKNKRSDDSVDVIADSIFALGLPYLAATGAATTHHGLSNGTSIGIGVVLAVGVAAFIAAVVLMKRCRRTRPTYEDQTQVPRIMNMRRKWFGHPASLVELDEREGGRKAERIVYTHGRATSLGGETLREKNDPRLSVDSLGKPVSVLTLA